MMLQKSKSAVDAISDEEADTPTPTPNTNVMSQPSSRPPSSLAADDEQKSGSDLERSKKGKKRKRMYLFTIQSSILILYHTTKFKTCPNSKHLQTTKGGSSEKICS